MILSANLENVEGYTYTVSSRNSGILKRERRLLFSNFFIKYIKVMKIEEPPVIMEDNLQLTKISSIVTVYCVREGWQCARKKLIRVESNAIYYV